jgi:hypothetical protein
LLAIPITRYFAFGGADLQITWKQVCLFPLFMLLYISEERGGPGGFCTPYIYIYREREREREPFDLPTSNQMEDGALLNIKA